MGTIMSRFLCFVLIFSFFISCSTPEIVQRDYQPFLNHEVDVEILLIDSSRIFMDYNRYKVESDTVIYFESNPKNLSKIAVKDILEINADVPNQALTIYLITGILLIPTVLIISSAVIN